MSIVRVGLSENPKYAEGWEAVFGKKKSNKSATRSNSQASAKKTKKSSGKKAKK
jgi:hypothetical protein